MQAFAKYYSRHLSKPETVDLGVYKRFQQIRILGSTKKDDADTLTCCMPQDKRN
jgi:hypothetical protein